MPSTAVEVIAPAVVLRVQPVGDADVVAVLFCAERGRIDAFGRAVRSSRKRFEGAALQPFNEVEASIQPARKGGLPTVRGAAARAHLLGPSPSYAQLVAGSYLLEMAGQLCQPGHADPALYLWVVTWTGACGRADAAALPPLLAAAELGALWVAGMLPELDRCARCGAAVAAQGAAWPAGGDGLACRACCPPGAPWLPGADLRAIDDAVRGADPDRVALVAAPTWALVSERARSQLHHALRGPLRTGQAVADTLRGASAAAGLAAP